jgi:purine-binding chemotaxis protein CheW
MQDSDTDLENADAGMQLIFRIDGDVFAISVTYVHEILDPQDMTPVPNANPFAPNLINVRGAVVPVIDLHFRLGFTQNKDCKTRRTIVFEHPVDGVPQKLAFCADSVEKVVECDFNALEPVPSLGAVWPKNYLRGAFRYDSEIVILLDTDIIFAPNITNAVEAA